MSPNIDIAKETESAYLAGVAANLKSAGSRFIAGSWFKREEHDRGEQVRATMADRRLYDRDLFSRMPHGRGFTIRGYERRWIFGRRVTSVTIASVLSPAAKLLDGDGKGAPVTRAELMQHVQGLLSDVRAPHVIGVCSPTGFADDVWDNPPDFGNVKLILTAPREGGGFRVAAGGVLDKRLVQLFDPEDAAQKIRRVKKAIEARSSDLLVGGITAGDLSRELELPEPLVVQALEAIARTDPELKVSKSTGEAMLYRTASFLSGEEERSMGLADWIRSLFSREGEEAKKINVLSERRAALSSKLERLYVEIDKLEKREQKMLDEGKAASSAVAKRSKAAQIGRLRKDISRFNTTAAILSKQINVISTHIHNLELSQTGSLASLPSSEELTEAAVNAEEILEQLSASDELVSGLEVGMAESAMSADEAAILKELQGDAAPEATAKGAKSTAERASQAKSTESRERNAQAEG